ncbi:hypothetical protein AAMO2058_000958500 [Amorphochlora amoebiformis]|uniref:Peroxisome assembly protein 12 n=1 Tax=Amorphochlora amoebiformis TaxID=1561963 RepID=A0A6T6YJB3_9EUKA|mmetsp:Transcript_6487/g.9982  ORF Transcript_6487/g.9982 Transcript_6487/m.9982 type:complete len:375 (+) Transcript_6487:41-1165(+)
MAYRAGVDLSRPSFFEVAAADRLIQGLRPALQHILTTAANHVPNLSFLANRGDEIFYLMCFLLDRHYLKTQSASFAENFYCLKRVRISPDGRKGSLDSMDRLWALLSLTLVPYLRSKLEMYYLEIKQNLQTFPQLLQDGSLTSGLKKLYIWVYPGVAALYEGLEYVQAVRYVLGSTNNFSPLTLLVKQRVERLTLEDMMAKRQMFRGPESKIAMPSRLESMTSSSLSNSASWALLESAWEGRLQRVSMIRRILAILSRIGSLVADNAKWAVYVGVFAIRFLQWWYSPENQQRTVRPSVVPPPPPRSLPHPKGLETPEDKSKCPICLRTRVNAALLPSGYVFCYTCIFNHLQTHAKCPVTLRPCRIEELRKIYES